MKIKPTRQADYFNRSKKDLKPFIEKRRRDRMNQSLEALRVLLLGNEDMKKLANPRAEKAEILESTVKFLKEHLRGTQLTISYSDPVYEDGFKACLDRAVSFLQKNSKVDYSSSENASVRQPDLALTFSRCIMSRVYIKTNCSRAIAPKTQEVANQKMNCPNKAVETKVGISGLHNTSVISGGNRTKTENLEVCDSQKKLSDAIMQRHCGKAGVQMTLDKLPTSNKQPQRLHSFTCTQRLIESTQSQSSSVWRPWP